MTLNDIEHLPRIVTNTLGIDDVLLAIDPEIIKLRHDVREFVKELYVHTTTNLIDRWERDFNLPFDASLSLEERRQRVLNKLARKKTLTWENLKLLIKNNLAERVQFYVVNDSHHYAFNIIVQTEDYAQMEKAVRQAKPAYLTFRILVTNFKRRCGTFYGGTEPL